MLLILPYAVKNAIMAHGRQWDTVNADHQGVITFILFDKLQRAGLIRVALIDRVTQQEQYRFVTSKLSGLVDSMPKTSLLTLINIMKPFADIDDMILIFLRFCIQFTEMLFRKRARSLNL